MNAAANQAGAMMTAGAAQLGFQQGPTPAGMKPHRGVLLLILSAVSFFICWIAAPVTFFLARQDKKAIADGQMDPAGTQFTTIAYWFSLAWTILGLLGICLWGLSVVLSIVMQ
jgi:hypothetical protein